MDPQQAEVYHQSRPSSGNWEIVYAVEALEPAEKKKKKKNLEYFYLVRYINS